MAWYNTSWLYRVKITIDKGQVPSTQTDFTGEVDLSHLPAGFFANVKSDGGDIRTTQSNGTTELARAVIVIDAGSSTGVLIVKISSVSGSVDTDIYIYYGNSGASEPAASSTYGSENAVDVNTIALYTFQQDPTAGAPQLTDITGNSLDGTAINTPSSVAGQIGDAWQFSGASSEHVTLPDNVLWDSTEFSFSGWIYKPSVVNWDRVFDFSDSISAPPGPSQGKYFALTSRAGDTQKVAFFVANAGFTGAPRVESTTTLPDATWTHIACTLSSAGAGTAKMYYNGALEATNSSFGLDLSDVTPDTLYLARSFFGADPYFTGIQDFFTFSSSVRSADWYTTEFNNQSNPGTFYSVGAQETRVSRAFSNRFNGRFNL